jgi:hypothetical protein
MRALTPEDFSTVADEMIAKGKAKGMFTDGSCRYCTVGGLAHQIGWSGNPMGVLDPYLDALEKDPLIRVFIDHIKVEWLSRCPLSSIYDWSDRNSTSKVAGALKAFAAAQLRSAS